MKVLNVIKLERATKNPQVKIVANLVIELKIGKKVSQTRVFVFKNVKTGKSWVGNIDLKRTGLTNELLAEGRKIFKNKRR